MHIFLTSDFGAVQKKYGTKVVCPADNSCGLVDQLKIVLRHGDFVFIPSFPESYEKNQQYADNIVQSFTLAGLTFQNKVIVDDRNAEKISEILKNASMVFLSGGYPISQIEFIKKFGIDKCLAKYEGVILGQSAGAMNLAKMVYNYPEEVSEINDAKFWNGVGLSDITIIPHFDLKEGNQGVEGIDLINDYFLPDSYNCIFFGIPNGSHVWIKDKNPEFYGDAYLIKDGKITALNKTNNLEK